MKVGDFVKNGLFGAGVIIRIFKFDSFDTEFFEVEFMDSDKVIMIPNAITKISEVEYNAHSL